MVSKVDLRKLLSPAEDSLTFRARVAINGRTVDVSCLADTGADGYIFVDHDLVSAMIRGLGLRTIRLLRECPVTGFNGALGEPITHAVKLTLMIDGHVQQQQPMLVTELGNNDLILGRMWFEAFGVLPDCKNRRLLWPDHPSLREEAQTDIARPIPRQILKQPKANESHQKDADRRNQLMEKPEMRERKVRKTYGYSHQEDTVDKMNRSLRNELIPSKRKKRTIADELPRKCIEIAAIGGVGFHRHMTRKGTETFVTSLAQIDRILDEMHDPEHAFEAGEIRARIPKVYHQFVDIFSKIDSNTLPPLRGAPDHRIELEGAVRLGYCPLYKMSAEELRFAKDYIMQNLAKGFIVPSTAPYASPILMAAKPGGGLRFCVDYRKLNELTKKDRYPIPLIDELLQRVSKAKFFTKLDIQQGFHRIRMHPDSEDLTTFRTRYGAYKYKVMPFGLTNGPATFQRYINHALSDYLDDFCTAFIDDILIYTDGDERQHTEHVTKVLTRLRAAGLQVDLQKCEFHTTETKFLGFIIGTEGVRVDPAKIEVIEAWQQPNTMRGVQSFLGMCNFYRRFIKNYSKIAKPLHRLTRKEVPFR